MYVIYWIHGINNILIFSACLWSYITLFSDLESISVPKKQKGLV